MDLSTRATELIRRRFSCRTYARMPIPEDRRLRLQAAAEEIRTGPLGSPLRFRLVAAHEGDGAALRGLGTYGFIRSPEGFLVGAVAAGEKSLEDFGYAMESLVLAATDLGLGSCWLGGTFTRGSFARRIELGQGERMPAVVSVGLIPDDQAARNGAIRRLAGGSRRLPWEKLFFDGRLGAALTPERAGPMATALEMVRLAPSASNKQPWRVVRDGAGWHFLLRRTPGYGGGVAGKLLGIEDMQRVDIGIAMCHLDLAVRELGLRGRWVVRTPAPEITGGEAEYVVSWIASGPD